MKLTAAIAAGLFIILLFWLGGYDFDERGYKAVALTLLTVYVSLSVYFTLKIAESIE